MCFTSGNIIHEGLLLTYGPWVHCAVDQQVMAVGRDNVGDGQGSTEPWSNWEEGNNRVPSAGFLSTESFKEEDKGQLIFQQSSISTGKNRCGWDGSGLEWFSLDGTHANSFNTKYKMVREYIYVIHSTQGEGEKWFSLIYNINKIDGIVWYTMTFDLDNYKYIL